MGLEDFCTKTDKLMCFILYKDFFFFCGKKRTHIRSLMNFQVCAFWDEISTFMDGAMLSMTTDG